MFKKIFSIFKSKKIKSLSQIDNIDDLIKYEGWINKKGCPTGKQGKPGKMNRR